jgi:hypothetical protein
MSKLEVLEGFAKRVPNAEKMMIDWLNDSIEIYFDGIHCKKYAISDILKKFVELGGRIE